MKKLIKFLGLLFIFNISNFSFTQNTDKPVDRNKYLAWQIFELQELTAFINSRDSRNQKDHKDSHKILSDGNSYDQLLKCIDSKSKDDDDDSSLPEAREANAMSSCLRRVANQETNPIELVLYLESIINNLENGCRSETGVARKWCLDGQVSKAHIQAKKVLD